MIALVRNENIPIAVAIELMASLPAAVARGILEESHLSEEVKKQLRDAFVANSDES